MRNYILGVDGGGTKTHCALFDTDGNLIDMLKWGPTNHEALKGSFSELADELHKMLECLSDRNGMDTGGISKSVFGMAGVDTKRQNAVILEIIRGLGIKDFILCNDAYLGIKAGCPEGYGICAINGTGCTVAGIDDKGNMLQIGGLGRLTGDCGGGNYLGTCAVSEVYNSLFKEGRHTLMVELMFEKLCIQSGADFVDGLTQATGSGKYRIKDLNGIVFEAANLGDAAALEILEKMGIENGKSINGIIKHLDFNMDSSIPVILVGSIYTKGENPKGIDSLKAHVINANPGINFDFKLLKQPPVAGAAVWGIKEALGKDYRNSIHEKVLDVIQRAAGY